MFRQIIERPVVGASVGFIGLVVVFFTLIIAQSVKRWRRLEQQRTEFEV